MITTAIIVQIIAVVESLFSNRRIYDKIGDIALDRSASLHGYSFLVAEIRNNIRGGMTRDDAIIAAIELCIRQDVLKTFLKDHFEEVIKMLNYEYDAEAEKRIIRQEGRSEGRQEGVDILAKFLKDGLPVDEALEKARKVLDNQNA